MNELIRVWEAPEHGYRLELFDTHRTGPYGKARLAYAFRHHGAVVFEGDDYFPAPQDAIDSDASVGGLLSFLALRPGDADAEWFACYTDAQLEFAVSEGETLALLAAELEEVPYGDDPEGGCSRCGDPFADYGEGRRSPCDDSLCSYCYCNTCPDCDEYCDDCGCDNACQECGHHEAECRCGEGGEDE